MFVVYNGRVCVMVYDENTKQWIYIPEEQYKTVEG